MRAVLSTLALTLVVGVAHASPASRSIEQIDAKLARIAAGPKKGPPREVGEREFLRRVRYRSGHVLVHAHRLPLSNRLGEESRDIAERAVYLTARHLAIPLRVAPPIVPSEHTVFGEGYLSTWHPRLHKLEGLDSDVDLEDTLVSAAVHRPGRIDWESVHALLILDHITLQRDREPFNVFFQVHRGRLGAIALDNEGAFDVDRHRSESRGGLLRRLVRIAPERSGARRLSARLRRGLAAIDVQAWQDDLRRTGVRESTIARATRRLVQVQEKGLAAVFGSMAER